MLSIFSIDISCMSIITCMMLTDESRVFELWIEMKLEMCVKYILF